MKYLKRIGYGLIALLILFIGLGIFMSKDIDINVSREIEAPVPVVYHIVNDISNQTMWNPWLNSDESMTLTFSDNTIGEGASYSWISENSGTGSQTITASIPNQRIDMNVVFDNEEASLTPMTFVKTEDGTSVNWSFKGRVGFPQNIMGPFIRRSIKSAYKKGLSSLNDMAAERWEEGMYYDMKVTKKELPQRNFVSKRAEVKTADMQQFYATNLGGLFQAVQAAGVEMDGMPCGLFYHYNTSKNLMDMAAAIPVKQSITIANAAPVYIPEGEGLVVDHYGDYSGLPIAHKALEAYMRDRGLIHNAPYIEEYLTDPTEEEDPGKILTKVYYYLAETGK
jgi:effector-binding domain-containing protein